MPKFYESTRKEIQVIDDEVSTIAQDINSLSSAVATVDNEVSTLTDNLQIVDNEISTIDNQLSTVLQDIDSLSSAIQTIDNEVSVLDNKVEGLSTAIQRKPASKDWWSIVQAVMTITGTSTAKTLPDVTIPGSGGNRLPAGVTIQGAIAMVKFRKIENTNATNTNALSHAQHIQVRDDTPGSWHNALTLPDGILAIATAAVEGGDLWIGNIDLSSTGYIDAADTYEFQIDEARAEQANLKLWDIQTGIRVHFT